MQTHTHTHTLTSWGHGEDRIQLWLNGKCGCVWTLPELCVMLLSFTSTLQVQSLLPNHYNHLLSWTLVMTQCSLFSWTCTEMCLPETQRCKNLQCSLQPSPPEQQKPKQAQTLSRAEQWRLRLIPRPEQMLWCRNASKITLIIRSGLKYNCYANKPLILNGGFSQTHGNNIYKYLQTWISIFKLHKSLCTCLHFLPEL